MTNGEAFQRIVVAFDGSKDSEKAVRFACSLAAKHGSKVTVVHVYRSPAVVLAPGMGMPAPDFGALEDAAEEQGRRTLAAGLDLATKCGTDAKGELIENPSVVEAIVDFAAKENADLIVVGTRGMTGFKRLLVGSVSSGVVNHARCPVLVVR